MKINIAHHQIRTATPAEKLKRWLSVSVLIIIEKGLVVELTAGGSKLLSRALMSTGSLAAVFRHDLLIYKYSADVRNVVKSNLEL